MENELVTIVLPIYNVEKYLNRCIESVVNQTYTNLEIILVDDGSPDNCPQICDEWAKKDSRIRVIHKPNGGLSAARNIGLDICSGKYIVFVDSDDFVHPEYVEYLLHLIVENQADLSICEFQIETQDGNIINRFINDGYIQLMDQQTALFELCRNARFSHSACAKMYLASAFSDIRYPVGHIYEDLATIYKLFLKANHIAFGHRVLYNYVYHEKSISHSPFNLQKIDLIIYAEQMCNDVLHQYPQFHSITQKRLFTEYAHCLRMMSLSFERSDEFKQLYDNVYRKLIKTRCHAWKNHPSLKERFYILCSLLGKRFLRIGFVLEAKIYHKYKLKA